MQTTIEASIHTAIYRHIWFGSISKPTERRFFFRGVQASCATATVAQWRGCERFYPAPWRDGEDMEKDGELAMAMDQYL